MQLIRSAGSFSVIILVIAFTSCGNTSEENIEKHYDDTKHRVEQEFVQEMEGKGNQEISIDELEDDLNHKDAELEKMMQDMEDEMDSDVEGNEPKNLDSLG